MIICTPGSNLAFADILSRNVTVEVYEKHQLQHKKKPRGIEFYDEHGSPVTYRIQHVDNPNDTSNSFYPILCQQRKDKKVLRLHIDGENFTLTVSVISFFQQRYNPQPTVSDWAKQSINSDAYIYLQHNP